MTMTRCIYVDFGAFFWSRWLSMLIWFFSKRELFFNLSSETCLLFGLICQRSSSGHQHLQKGNKVYSVRPRNCMHSLYSVGMLGLTHCAHPRKPFSKENTLYFRLSASISFFKMPSAIYGIYLKEVKQGIWDMRRSNHINYFAGGQKNTNNIKIYISLPLT